MDVTEELLKTIDSNDTHYNVALEILDLRFSSTLKQWEVQVRWKGFDDDEPTWEPILNIAEDISDMLNAFLDKHHEKANVAKAR